MIRFLNFLQGLVSFVAVVLAALFGWPIWITIMGLILPLLLSFVIFSSREETVKGRLREIIELVFGFIFGIGGLLFWAFGSQSVLSLNTPTPGWLAITALPSVLFNLGIVIAWICWLLGIVLGYIQEALEFISGETVRASE